MASGGSRVCIAFALLAIVPVASAATRRSFAVEVSPEAPPNDWRAEALATTLVADLADDRLAAVESHTRGNAELVVEVSLEAGHVVYTLRATWPNAPSPIVGSVAAGTIDRSSFAGRLRDQLHRLARTDDRVQVMTANWRPATGGVLAITAVVAVLIGIPFGVALMRRRRGVLELPALRHAVFAVLAIGGGAQLLSWIGATTTWLFAGGVAWGTFVVVTMPILFPPLIGLGRIEHDELGRVLGAWLVAVARRIAGLLVLYVPFAILIQLAMDAAGMSALAAPIAIPLVLLAVRMSVRCAVEIAALEVDERLVDATADAAAWQDAVRGYVVGYLRRAGLPVDVELLERVRVLVGTGNEVAVYGGGLTHSRIVIPRRMLELALAPAGRPHDYAAPRVSMLHWAQWNAGLVVPTEPDVIIATADQRQPRAMTVDGDSAHELFGQLPTLAGVIEPSDLDIDHRDYRPHDDPMWLYWDPGDEYDGTDAGDRDFLFGVVIHALGDIQRHAERLATFAWLGRASVRRIALRDVAIADHHAALGGARYHLAQYLAWRLWGRDDVLTARAYVPELEATSRQVIGRLGEVAAGDRQLRRRLVRLCDPRRPVPWQRFAVAGALATAIAVAGVAIAQAVRYHASYVTVLKESHGKD